MALTKFPYFLTRIAGQSFDILSQLNFSDELSSAFTNLLNKKRTLRALSDSISQLIYYKMPSIKEETVQKKLLNVKRDIFNCRTLTDQHKDLLKSSLNDDYLNRNILLYIQLQDEIKSADAHCATLFLREQASTRNGLQKIVEDTDFQNGLLLSSKVLLNSMFRYMKSDASKLTSKEQKTEQGIIKYLSRASAKTSPYSTLCDLGIGRYKKNKDIISILSTKNDIKVKSNIRLNIRCFEYLLSLLKKNNKISSFFPLRINPTIQKNSQQYLFLTNSLNIEAFQRLGLHPVLEIIEDIIYRHRKSGISYLKLLELLKEDVEAEDEMLRSYIDKLISVGFLEYYIAVSGMDVDWDIKFSEWLINIGAQQDEQIIKLIEALKDIRGLTNSYENAKTPNEREILLNQIFNKYRAICLELHIAAELPETERISFEDNPQQALKGQNVNQQGKQNEKEEDKKDDAVENVKEEVKEEAKEKEEVFTHHHFTYFYFKPEQIIFEDCSTNADFIVDADQAQLLLERLNNLCQFLDIYDYRRNAEFGLLNFFKETYGENDKIDLLRFYEDYSREMKKKEKEQEEKKKADEEKRKKEKEQNDSSTKSEEVKNVESKEKVNEQPEIAIPANIKELESNRAWIKYKFSIYIQKILSTKPDIVNFDNELLNEIKEGVKFERSCTNISAPEAILQFYKENKDLKIYLGGFSYGFGMFLSRFLYLYPDKMKKDLQTINRQLLKDDILAEINDATYFNANLRPALMPYEIWIPGANTTLPNNKQIPVSDIEVCINEQEQKLQLIHKKSQKRIYVFNLALQSIKHRSKLYQLLVQFSLSKSISPYQLTSTIENFYNIKEDKLNKDEKNKDKKAIQFYPRIVYENQIILKRKSWKVPKELMPLRAAIDTDYDYFKKVNEWREENNIPEEVFIVIGGQREGAMDNNNDSTNKSKLTRDDYKPQYIHFNNHFLVNLFEKLVTKLPDMAIIEEMLPTSKDLLRVDGERYVTECALSMYSQ